MDDAIRQAAASYYREKLRAHGPGAPGMDWKDAASQRLRFEVIASKIDWTKKPSVLDVGCGSGELLAFLRERGLEPSRYLGIDIVPEMVAACAARFGGTSARVATPSEIEKTGERFDWAIASGTFNVKQSTPETAWRAHFHDALGAMYGASRLGIVFNAMTAHLDWRHDHLYYATLDELAALAVSRLSRRFVIDHSYPLFELTMAVYRP